MDANHIGTDTRVRTLDGRPLQGDVRLPGLDGVEPVRDPFLDSVGRLVASSPLLVGGAGGAGLLLGAALPRRAIARVGGALLGAGAGLVAGLAVARAAQLASGRGASDSSAFVRRVDGAGTTPRTGESGEHLRVLDWNVRELIGPDGLLRSDDEALDAIAAVVEREHPDVLVLQEVSQGSFMSKGADNLEELADRLGATDAVHVPNGMRVSGKAKGQAILTFGDARIQDARGLRHPDPEGSGFARRALGTLRYLREVGIDPPDWLPTEYHPRTTTDAIVTTAGGNDVRVLDVHLSGTGGPATGGTPGSSLGQERQLVPLVDTLDAWSGPTMLLGDFNVNAHGEQYGYEQRLLQGAGMSEAFEQVGASPTDPAARSFPATGPKRNIDRAWSSGELRATGARVLSDEAASQGSDHLPLLLDYEVG